MKKFLSVLTALSLILLLSACGHRIVIEKKDDGTQSATVQPEAVTGFRLNDIEWAEKYFGTIFDFSRFDHYKIDNDSINYYNDNSTDIAPCNLDLTIGGEPLNFPYGYSEFNKIGFDFVETREEFGDRYMTYRSVALGQFENGNGSIISADLTSKDDVPTEGMDLCRFSFDINADSGNKCANSPEFEINGSINGSSSMQDVIKTLGSPSSVKISYWNLKYNVTVEYDGLTDANDPQSLCSFTFKFLFGQEGATFSSFSYWQNVPDIFTE